MTMRIYRAKRHKSRGSVQVEWAILASLIVVVALASITPVGNETRNLICKGVGAVLTSRSGQEFTSEDWKWDENASECRSTVLW